MGGFPKGTHYKLTPERRQKLEEAAAMDCTISEMALWADVTRQTIYTWLEEDKELKERIDKLREKPLLKARNTIVKNLDGVETAKWYVERKAKKEFSTRTETDITTGGKPLPILASLNAVPSDNSSPEDSEPDQAD